MTEQTRMGKKEFAAHIKRSPSYVTSLLKAGRLVMDGSGVHAKVLVAESLALIAKTQGARDDVAARHAHERGGDGLGHQPGPEIAPAASSGELAVTFRERRAEAELRKSLAQADQEEMQAAKMRGDLVAREDADAAMRDAGAAVRAALDVLADQLAPLVAPVADLDEVHSLIQEAARNAHAAIDQAIVRRQAELAGGARERP